MAKKRKRGRAVYTFFLFLYMILIALAALYALKMVWDYAEEYEFSRSSHTLDAYLETLNRERWSDGIQEAVNAMPHETQSDEEIKSFVQDKLSAGVTAVRKGGSNDGTSITYSLRCNGGEIGTVTLMEDETYRGKIDTTQKPWSLLPWRILPWKVSGESFNFDALYSAVEVVVPSEYSVWINGTRLGEDCITERGIHYDVYEDYYKYWDYLPTKVRYRFDHVIGEATPEIRDEKGNIVHIDENAGDSQFVPPVPEDFYERCVEFAIPFTRAYLTYISGVPDSGVHLAELRPYLMKGQDLEKRMEDALDGLGWAHTSSIHVDSVDVNSVLVLVDGYSVVDISSVAGTYYYGKGELSDTNNIKLMVYDDGEQLWAESLELY